MNLSILTEQNYCSHEVLHLLIQILPTWFIKEVFHVIDLPCLLV